MFNMGLSFSDFVTLLTSDASSPPTSGSSSSSLPSSASESESANQAEFNFTSSVTAN
jgi:hypothetical protein